MYLIHKALKSGYSMIKVILILESAWACLSVVKLVEKGFHQFNPASTSY
jgi:hypothetical protein